MKSNYTYILIVGLTALLAGRAVIYSSKQAFPAFDDLISGAVFVSREGAREKESKEREDQGSEEQNGPAVNFEKQGVLVVNNPGLKKDTLYLVYEEPGAPGLNKELVFEEESRCFAEEEINCSLLPEQESDHLSGLRIRLEGIEENGTVLVKHLYFLEDTSF